MCYVSTQRSSFFSCFKLAVVTTSGPKVISKVISTQTMEVLSKVLKRKAVIWDNIHANDYDQRRVFLGPYDGRPVELFPILNGVLTNPNCEFESNFIAVHTLAAWLREASMISVEEPMNIDSKTERTNNSGEPMDEDPLVNGAVVDREPKGSSVSKTEETNKGAVKEGEMETETLASLCDSKSNNNTVLYDPQSALREAVSAWLAEFSKVKHATSRTYAKSGAYCIPPEAIPAQVQATMATTTNTTTINGTVCSPGLNPSPTKLAKENSRKKLSITPPQGKVLQICIEPCGHTVHV